MSEVRAEEVLRDTQRDEGLPRRLGLTDLAHDAAIYGGTRVLLKSLAFLLVPLYAHFLSPTQFGVLELVLAAMALLDVFVNLPGALARFYFDRDEPAWRREVISLYFFIEAVYPGILIAALIAFSGPLAGEVTGSATYGVLLVIALSDVYLTNIVDLPMNLCRLRRKPVTFAVYALTRGLTQIVFSVLLVAVWHFGIKGILIASLTSAGVAFVITFREYARDLTRHVSLRVAREMVSFAWPTVISGLAFYVLNLFDRFFIKHYHGAGDVGLYGTAFRYSQVVIVGVFAFRQGWPQWHYSWLRTGLHPQMVARATSYYFFAVGFLAVAVSLWIRPLFHLIMPERYWDATYAVPPLALAAVATGAYTVFNVGFNVTRRMRLVPPIAAVGAAFAVGLYFLLVPPFSFLGAAWATVAAMWALAFLSLTVAQRIYPVPWQWRRMATAVGTTGVLALTALGVDAWLSTGISLPVRLALTAAYPLALFAVGFFPPADIEAFRARLRRLR
jgi:O-antigen/teichoic acid export membrane protein